ncbi:hypothetical protein BU25DRAFT_444271 [Macroventuria anomochaeta]|uniref:Uncharacterized protein n=1 Tax=Macroventuria anomochaeta TaxID=301207 RepID=A0ACB6SJ19_9PLEO|nr:uncharacterized protein BU25DRAFT_444271 [Macroventuria anomochaeta]KAF2633567.1 hypothetical protein BU25DRAFT_444271 [Macroventuria anomochaeta]
MASMSGLLNTITKAMPYVSDDKAADKTEDHEPLLAGSDSAGYLGEDEGSSKNPEQTADSQRSIRKSNSDLGLCERTRTRDSATDPVQTSLRLNRPADPGASLRPPRAKGHRSSSSSQMETQSRSEELACSDTTMQRGIIASLGNTRDTDTSKRSRNRCGSGADSPVPKDEEPMTGFTWCSSIRPISNPDLRKASRASSRPDPSKPLKTCLKRKAKSANTTPSNESVTNSEGSAKNQELRRMKTVDFEEAMSRLVPSQVMISSSAVHHRTLGLRKASKCRPSCPGTAVLSKRSPASPAMTRTDVHVIAVTPSSLKPAGLDPTQPRKADEADPATPTMQIVESNNGNYEVIWDDVPPEHSARTQRRSSSASQALEAVSTGTRGLEHVNTKLTEWSGTWNTPSDSFKPTIVVFPDDNGRRPHFECAVVDDEDIEIFAPPNSERVSAVHSRHPSRPASARMSRAASHDDSSAIALPQVTSLDDAAPLTEQTLVVPDSDAWSAHLVAARRKLGAPSPERKLSNVEEADLKFRNHRDSVTIAHSRLIHSGGVRPELFAYRDSVSMAKKRMHAKNHAGSAPKHVHRPESKSEPGPQLDDAATAIPPQSIVKAHAAEALKKGSPVPILRLSDSAGP